VNYQITLLFRRVRSPFIHIEMRWVQLSDNNMNDVDLNNVEITSEERLLMQSFVQAITNLDYRTMSPSTLNKALKDLNMNPNKKDRDTTEKMVANPKEYEKSLRELSQYLINVVMPLKRLKHYYSSILTYDYTLIPIVDESVIKSTAFKKAEKRVYDWLDALNPRKVFRTLTGGSIVEDVKYYYYREDGDYVTLQEMPSDYCKITYKDQMGYRYAFDMNYFLKSGVELEGFAPEFRQYYNDIFTGKQKTVTRYTPNWVELDEDKAFVFKFDVFQAGITPPLIGTFVDAVELDTYKTLKETKTALETYKLLVGTIPRNKENKSGNKKNDLAITADMATKFANIIKSAMPEGVDMKVTPFEEVKAFEFGQGAHQDDIVGASAKNFINNAGVSQTMSIDKPTQSTVDTGRKIDVAFVSHLYEQAQDFINHYLDKISPRYKFRIKFEGSIFDKEEREKSAKEWASFGIITDKIGASMGLNPREFDKMLQYMKSRGYPDLWTPVQSAHQSSGKDTGRPEKSGSELSDNGAVSKELDK
jgi:hypothetical protein